MTTNTDPNPPCFDCGQPVEHPRDQYCADCHKAAADQLFHQMAADARRVVS